MRPFPSAPSAGKWQVSESGAKFPLWSPNRRELFYVNSDNRIMLVPFTANGRSFVPEKSRQWSPAPLFRPNNNALWNLDIAPDGRRFVVLAQPESRERGAGYGPRNHPAELLRRTAAPLAINLSPCTALARSVYQLSVGFCSRSATTYPAGHLKGQTAVRHPDEAAPGGPIEGREYLGSNDSH